MAGTRADMEHGFALLQVQRRETHGVEPRLAMADLLRLGRKKPADRTSPVRLGRIRAGLRPLEPYTFAQGCAHCVGG
jgi:hypothetical protein